MKHNVSGGLHFFAGDVWDDTEEYLSCPNCGMRQEYPKAPRGHLPEVSF
jgi:rubredoxin